MAKQPQIRRSRRKMSKTEAAAPLAPKTLAEKLAAAEALVEKYKREIALETIKNDIADKDDVDFSFGRGDSKRTMTGTVAGLADTDQGKIVAVSITDDAGLPEIKRVNIRDILVNRTADERRAAAVKDGGDADPLNTAE